MTVGLAPLDVAMAVGYVVAVVLVGMLWSKRRASSDDFFLASHQARWPMIGLSLVASNISPTALIGITGAAYAIGISVYNYEWMAAAILVVFAAVFLPMVLRSGVYTVPEFLERRFDVRVRIWFAILTLLLTVLLDAAGSLYACAVLLKLLMPELSLPVLVVGIALIAGLYTVAGGLRAVLHTETIQGVVVLASALVLSVLAVDRAGGWSVIMASAPPAQLSLIRPADDPYMPWTGLLLGAPILSFFFWCTNQYMVQRMLAAKSIADGQIGLLFAAFLKLTTLFLIVLPGIAALTLYPGLARGDEAYPRLLLELLPTGLVGILLAAFVGATLAQLSATYNSAATIVAIDFVKRLRPELPGHLLVRWGRLATLACMLASVIWAPQIDRFPSLWQYLQAVMAYTTPPVVALFLIGTLWRGATAQGAIWAIMLGGGLGLMLFTLLVVGVAEIQFLHVAAWVFAVSAVTLIVVSLRKPRFEPRANGLVIGDGGALAELVQLPHSFRIGAIILLAAIATIVFIFR